MADHQPPPGIARGGFRGAALLIGGLLLLLPALATGQPRGPQRGPRPPQQPQQQRVQSSELPGSVSGTVVNAVTKEPLRKVQLTLRSAAGGQGEAYAASSNDGGQFTFTGVMPGSYRIAAERTGFVPQSGFQGRTARREADAEVKAGQAVTGVVVELMPQAVVTGKIMDDDGEPVQSVAVQVARIRYVSGRKELTAVGMAVSNDLGEYRVFNLPPGRYYVSAAKRSGGFRSMMGFGGPSPQVEEDYVAVYYPGVLDPEMAAPLDLRAGMEMRGVDVRIAKASIFRVRGQVTGLAAAPEGQGRPAPVMVSLVPKGAAGSMLERGGTRVDPQSGAFEIQRVRPGSYTLVAIQIFGRESRFGRLPLEVGEGDVDGATVTLQAPVDLAGSVRVEEQDRAPGGLSVAVVATETFMTRFTESSRAAPVDDSGRFRFERLGPGRYRVMVRNAPEGHYLMSARLGTQDVLAPGLDLSSGIAGGTLDLVIGPGAGAVEGTVQNESREGAPDMTLTLVPQGESASRTDLYRTVNSGEGGAFLIPSVPPGDYKLFAWEKVEPGAWQDPDFLRPFDNRSVSVRIGESGRENVQLRAIPSSETEGF